MLHTRYLWAYARMCRYIYVYICCQNALKNNYSKSRPLNRDRCCFNRMCGFLNKSRSSGKDRHRMQIILFKWEKVAVQKFTHFHTSSSVRARMYVCMFVCTLARRRVCVCECVYFKPWPVFYIFFAYMSTKLEINIFSP